MNGPDNFGFPPPTRGPGCGGLLAWWTLVAVVAGIVALVDVLF